jgi:hypothetical protein
MLVINVNNDTGKPHRIKIPNSLYLPGLKMCLLSPQHWAQEAGDDYPLPNDTWMKNNVHSCILLWGQGNFSKTIPFDLATNMRIFYMLPSTLLYRAFVNTFMACEVPFFSCKHVLQIPCRRRLDGNAPPPEEFMAEENVNFKKTDTTANEGAVWEDDDTVLTGNLPPPPELAPHPDLLRCNALTFDPSPVLDKAKEYFVVALDNQAKLMRWHYHLGHALFCKLKQLAHNGEIPTKLANVRPPRCSGCLFGAMTKVPWRTKKRQDDGHAIFAATKQGECISVYHMQSTEPGFYTQAKGALTKTRYRNATIFIDDFLHLQFVYLITNNLTLSETINAMHAFKRFAAKHGVRTIHYHCNNGRFADSMFHEACKAQQQKLTFCRVNAHFQMALPSKPSASLRRAVKKQLLHACQLWRQAVSTALWPYALRHAAHLNNVLPMLPEGQLKLELFSSIKVGSNMRFLHTFGCPVFALNNALPYNPGHNDHRGITTTH